MGDFYNTFFMPNKQKCANRPAPTVNELSDFIYNLAVDVRVFEAPESLMNLYYTVVEGLPDDLWNEETQEGLSYLRRMANKLQ